MQDIKWDIALCNLFVWTITFFVLSKGIKSLGKVIIIMCLRKGMVEDVGDVFPQAIYSVVLGEMVRMN